MAKTDISKQEALIIEYEIILDDSLNYLPIQGVLLIAYTVFYVRIMWRFNKVLSPSMRAILTCFQVMLVIRFIFDTIMMIYYKKEQSCVTCRDQWS